VALLRYHLREEKWFLYNDTLGYYKQLLKLEINQVFYDWADLNDFKSSDSLTNHALKRLSLMVKTNCVWDSGVYEGFTRLENTKEGLLDLDSKQMIEHTPGYMSKAQTPRIYYPNITKTPAEIVKVYSATPDWERLHNFMVSVCQGRHENEMFLMLYGKRGAGKSTVLRVAENIYGKDNRSKTKLQRLGRRFGLKECYDKRVNVNPDLSPDAMNSETISTVKQLTGEDGDIEVELKNVDSFKHPIQVFLMFGANQLMKFSKKDASEIESVMRRACLVHYPEAQKRDTKFKKALVQSDFLDRAWSYWINCEFKLMLSDEDDDALDTWVNQTLEQWLTDSEPVMRILKELYEFDKTVVGHDPKKGTPLYKRVQCNLVAEEVGEVLTSESLQLPGDLQADITQAFKSMGIIKNNRRGIEAYYLKLSKIEKKDEDIESSEPTEPTAPQQMDSVLQKKAPVIFQGYNDIDDAEANDLKILAQTKRTHLSLIFKKICELQHEEPAESVSVNDILETLTSIGLTQSFIQKAMVDWVKDDTLYEVTNGKYKLASKKLF